MTLTNLCTPPALALHHIQHTTPSDSVGRHEKTTQFNISDIALRLNFLVLPHSLTYEIQIRHGGSELEHRYVNAPERDCESLRSIISSEATPSFPAIGDGAAGDHTTTTWSHFELARWLPHWSVIMRTSRNIIYIRSQSPHLVKIQSDSQ